MQYIINKKMNIEIMYTTIKKKTKKECTRCLHICQNFSFKKSRILLRVIKETTDSLYNDILREDDFSQTLFQISFHHNSYG